MVLPPLAYSVALCSSSTGGARCKLTRSLRPAKRPALAGLPVREVPSPLPLSNHLMRASFNDAAKRGIYSLQEFFVLAGKALGFIFLKPFYTTDLFQQKFAIGVDRRRI